jgi:hypothetical protein
MNRWKVCTFPVLGKRSIRLTNRGWASWQCSVDCHAADAALVGKEEHRTEVTEATERGLRLAGEPKLVDTAAVGRELRESGKASHRGHRGHREGLRLAGEPKLVDTAAAGRELRESGEASHKGYGGHVGV